MDPETRKILEGINYVDLDELESEFSKSTTCPVAFLAQLHFIALYCPRIRDPCLQMIIKYCKSFSNVVTYQAVKEDFKMLKSTKNFISGNQFDPAFEEQVRHKQTAELTRFDSELNTYKMNSFTSHYVRCLTELGLFHIANCSFGQAMESLRTARELCHNEQIVRSSVLCCLSVAHFYRLQFHLAHSVGQCALMALSSSKRQNGSSVSATDAKDINHPPTQSRCSAGLSAMQLGLYEEAADLFTEIDIDLYEVKFLVSCQSICTYGGLCALATFGRDKLKYLYHNSHFRQFLELRPHIREAIACFLDSKYSQMFTILDSVKNKLLMDIFLCAHVNALYSLIRIQAFIQFFLPFKTLSLERVSETFKQSTADLEEELFKLAKQGKIDIKIDLQSKVITTNVNESSVHSKRLACFEKTLILADDIQQTTRCLSIR